MSGDDSPIGGSGHRVLIVGGDGALRRLLGIALAAFGCASYEARDGPEALAALRERRMCAVIVDLPGPGASRRSVLEALGGSETDRRPAAIAVASDHAALVVAAELGVGATLLKPFSLQHLQAAIEGLVAREGSAHRPTIPFRLSPILAARRSPGARQGDRSAIAS